MILNILIGISIILGTVLVMYGLGLIGHKVFGMNIEYDPECDTRIEYHLKIIGNGFMVIVVLAVVTVLIFVIHQIGSLSKTLFTP